jgi:hypothetical protein
MSNPSSQERLARIASVVQASAELTVVDSRNATHACMKALAAHWHSAIENEKSVPVSYSDMWRDIDEVIGDLLSLKLGLTQTANADVNMRRTLDLPYDMPDFDSLDPDTQMEWVAYIRTQCSGELGSESAFRYAKASYLDEDGVLPAAKTGLPTKLLTQLGELLNPKHK